MTRSNGPRARYSSNGRAPLLGLGFETSRARSQYSHSSRLAYIPSASSGQHSLNLPSRGHSRACCHSHYHAYRYPYKLEDFYDEGYNDALSNRSRASLVDHIVDLFPDALPDLVPDLFPFSPLRPTAPPPDPLRYAAALPSPTMRDLSRAGLVAIPIPVPVPVPILSRDEADHLDQLQQYEFPAPSASEINLDSYTSSTLSSGSLTPTPSTRSDSRPRVFNWAICGSESDCTEDLESLDRHEAREDGPRIRTHSNSCEAFSDRNLGRGDYRNLLGLNLDGSLSHSGDYHNLLGLTPFHSTAFSSSPTATSMIKDLQAERDRLLKTARAYDILVKKQVEKERREMKERTEVLGRVETELAEVKVEEEVTEGEINGEEKVEEDLKGKTEEEEKLGG